MNVHPQFRGMSCQRTLAATMNTEYKHELVVTVYRVLGNIGRNDGDE